MFGLGHVKTGLWAEQHTSLCLLTSGLGPRHNAKELEK
jgi:hypothetical protein